MLLSDYDSVILSFISVLRHRFNRFFSINPLSKGDIVTFILLL